MTWQQRKTSILLLEVGKNGVNWNSNQADRLSHSKNRCSSRLFHRMHIQQRQCPNGLEALVHLSRFNAARTRSNRTPLLQTLKSCLFRFRLRKFLANLTRLSSRAHRNTLSLLSIMNLYISPTRFRQVKNRQKRSGKQFRHKPKTIPKQFQRIPKQFRIKHEMSQNGQKGPNRKTRSLCQRSKTVGRWAGNAKTKTLVSMAIYRYRTSSCSGISKNATGQTCRGI